MGVPSFYRWLSEKYPKIVKEVIESRPQVIDGVEIGVNTVEPNPNGIEFDNLYLDMNGLIHPCCHPEDKPQPESEEEMIAEVFLYIDRIFAMVRPRRLLYMAIDGVAPRAKMNQQRSRRFRAAMEAVEKSAKEDEIREEWARKGHLLPEKKTARWDHNVITPGTPFMHKLALSLRFYVNERLSTDPGWQNVQVVFSDASVPGEGEHKIMQFVRQQRMLDGYLPNTRHVIYGMDADLIMLALATHEPHFTVVRETVLFGKDRGCFKCNQKGHNANDCPGKAKVKETPNDETESVKPPQPFQFLSISVLREYLAHELFVGGLPFRWDLERVIDDFVFLCFFVGNDFLPHLPSLEIREGALDDLMKLYLKKLPSLGGYLTDAGVVDLARTDVFLREIGEVEPEVFRKRRFQELRSAQREQQREQAAADRKRQRQQLAASSRLLTPEERQRKAKRRKGDIAAEEAVGGLKEIVAGSALAENVSAARLLKARLAGAAESSEQKDAESTLNIEEESPDEEVDFEEHLKEQLRESARVPEHDDKVKLHEGGYKERYYAEKFEYVSPRDDGRIRDVVRSYTEGLCWVMLYYYRGCSSWNWFYPYHYAPFASDLCDLAQLRIEFDIGTPFSPLSQLMGVLPAASSHCLPPAYAKLMDDPASPIVHFYPQTFDVDLNGKRWAWQAVVLLPFIDEKLLLDTLQQQRESLTAEEKARDSKGHNYVFVSAKHPIANTISAMYLRVQDMEAASMVDVTEKLEPSVSSGHNGRVAPYPNAPLLASAMKLNLGKFSQNLSYNRAISARLINPKAVPHRCQLLPCVQLPAPVLSSTDLDSITQTRRFGGRSILGGSQGHAGNGGPSYTPQQAPPSRQPHHQYQQHHQQQQYRGERHAPQHAYFGVADRQYQQRYGNQHQQYAGYHPQHHSPPEHSRYQPYRPYHQGQQHQQPHRDQQQHQQYRSSGSAGPVRPRRDESWDRDRHRNRKTPPPSRSYGTAYGNPRR